MLQAVSAPGARAPTEAQAERERGPFGDEARRRLAQLMLFRVVLITFVLGATVALYAAEPEQLAAPNAVVLFAIIGITYALSLVYALRLRRSKDPRRFATIQFAGDLVVTTTLVHATGGAQSGYTFFYVMTIVGAALVHYRRGALFAAIASLSLFVAVSLAGWYHLLPVPAGQRLVPWDLGAAALVRQLALNGAAFAAVAFLAARLGELLATTGARLERQQAQSADLAALSADVIRCLSSGLVTVDARGQILDFNEAAGEILETAPELARGRGIDEISPEIGGLLRRAGGGRADLRREVLTVPRPEGDRTLGVSVSPLTNHQGEHVGHIVNFSDLTELRRMEVQVKRAEQLAAVGQMAAGVAHEIRNPLASISGSIELLRLTPQLDADSATLMDIVVREVDRLNGLITDLLDYTRPRERMPVRLELGGLLEETLRVFAQDRSANAVRTRFVAEPAARGVEVLADPGQIRQVVWNLLRNAVEAMPDGGELTVTLERIGDWVEFTVADTGVGISPEDQSRLFEPFFTRKTRGSGLGLAIVFRIVSEHGGQVRVDSAPGEGTRMIVRLPTSSTADHAPMPSEHAS